jgi:hypothetical protein
MNWWINDKWYYFRLWLAEKIFPEIVMHIKVAERLAVIDENLRIVNAIKDADSACEGWALSFIERKYHSIDDFFDSIGKIDE